jgi:hypothetical protein
LPAALLYLPRPATTAMRIAFLLLLTLPPALGQQPELNPNQTLRTTMAEWVETMRKIQTEEDNWANDKEVLGNYREGLEREIADLNERIAAAKTRKDGADKESLDLTTKRTEFVSARDSLVTEFRKLEAQFKTALGIIPPPLRKEPRVAQLIEDFEKAAALPDDKADEGISKRVLTLVNLVSEIEKFQQTVVVRPELHRDSQDREFNMQVVYFGLSAAYAVNKESTFALVGKPTAEGWKYEPRPDLAKDIQRMLAAILGDAEAAFTNLPFALE